MRTPAASLLLAAALALPAWAGKSVVVGQTYPIAEPDLLVEIRQQAATKDWRSWMRRKPADYSAFDSVTLPRAKATAERLFDPTYALPFDIRDEQGKVLFPKGMTVNVYDRIRVPGRFIVIGPEERDFAWLRDVAKPRSGDKVLVAGGNALSIRQQRRLSVFALDDRFVERFGLRVVPAVVQQEGNRLRVREYALP